MQEQMVPRHTVSLKGGSYEHEKDESKKAHRGTGNLWGVPVVSEVDVTDHLCELNKHGEE